MNPPSPQSPLESLWRPTALFAVVLAGEALALVLALAPATSEDRLVSFGLASLGIQWIALGTLATLYSLRRLMARLPAPVLAWACLGLLLAMTAVVAVVAWWMLESTVDPAIGGMHFVARLLAMTLVVGLLALVAFQNYARARHLSVRAKQFELEALQARIRPHFLFNTLNTGAALVHAHPDEAERLLLDLADLFRAALRGPELIPLAKELELTRRYLEIEGLRLGPRLQVQWQLPEPLPQAMVPALSLQPLAENAVRHGIEPMPEGGRIEIEARIATNEITIVIRNDFDSGAARIEGHRVGLSSARERVMAMTAGSGDVGTRIENGRHVATVRLPLST